MTEHKFPPGPWRPGTGPDCLRIMAGSPKQYPKPVVEVCYDCWTDEKGKAIARLAIAAPALLVACERGDGLTPGPTFLRVIAQWLRAEGWEEGGPENKHSVLRSLEAKAAAEQAAIEKARGET